MINVIRFNIIAGKINKIPEFYTICCQKMPDYVIRRDRGQAEAKSLRPLWPRGLNITAGDRQTDGRTDGQTDRHQHPLKSPSTTWEEFNNK